MGSNKLSSLSLSGAGFPPSTVITLQRQLVRRCQSNLPRLSAKLELEIRRVLVVMATEQKVRWHENTENHGIMVFTLSMLCVSCKLGGGLTVLPRERPCGCGGLWRWNKTWPWNVVTLLKLPGNHSSLNGRCQVVSFSDSKGNEAFAREWIRCTFLVVAWWWRWPGPVGVKWGRSQGFAHHVISMQAPSCWRWL